MRKKTNEDFLNEMREKQPDILVKQKYIHAKAGIECECLVCGYGKDGKWKPTPNNLLKGVKCCPYCAKSGQKSNFSFNVGDIVNEKLRIVKMYHTKKYKDQRSSLKYCDCICVSCGYEHNQVLERNLKNGASCPACSKAPKVVWHKNCIATTDDWMVKYFVNQEDAYTHTKSSSKKVEVVCPNCQKTLKNKMSISRIYTKKGVSCPYCGDGYSYPEKFFISVLEQLNLDYEKQFSIEGFGFRYDFKTIVNNQIILIELHGEQHYVTKDNWGDVNQKDTDLLKYDVAVAKLGLNHGETYFVLNCRKSNTEWIKKSILDSQIPILLGFNESDIDWELCHKTALSSLLFTACEYKKNNEALTSSEIGDLLNINKNTVVRYLKKGAALGLCSYDPMLEVKKNCSKNGRSLGKRVAVFKDDIKIAEYESCTQLDQNSEKDFGIKFTYGGVAAACRENRLYKGYSVKYID